MNRPSNPLLTRPLLSRRQPINRLPMRPAAEPKLRFNFRFQRWSDVLEWFAEQAGLSLVLDAPPPGTFNYSDNREFSVAESLDLLNGVLLTKGFTLVRRERMLIVVDLSQGVPETLVPRVTLEELDKRGRFELVSVLFPVGKRTAAEVVTEISPLLSPRGKSQALPKTGQVLVTDTAGVMRAISAVIESMPEPKEAATEKPEKPQLAVYPLKSADPDAAVQVLEALMPDAKFVRDPGANQLSAYATPTQQAAVKNVIEQLQTTEGPLESRARFEVYLLDNVDPAGALATLQPLVPTARLTIDPQSRKLAAWGTPADHEILTKAVGQMVAGVDGTDDRQVEVYRLSKSDPASVAAMLPNVVPRARIAVDPPTKSLVVLATLADQQTVRATIDQIESQKPIAGAPELRFYALDQTAPATLSSVLQTLVPRATVTVDAAQRRLAVTATPEDHAIVKQAVDEYLKATPSRDQRKLELYSVTPAELKRFQSVLAELATDFPNVKIVTDAEPGELAVWAAPGEHEVIAGIVAQLKQATPVAESYQLVAYPIRAADPASVLTVLQNLFPGTKLVLDAKTRRLVAWTRPSEQAAIKDLVEQMDSDDGGESQSQLMTYPVDGFDPNAAIATIKNLAPDATLTHDATAKTIVAFARKSEQTKIAEALRKLQPSDDPAVRPHVVSYSVGTADPNALYPLVNALVPTARVVPNAANGTIAVWAAPSDHAAIKSAIEEMTADGSDSTAPKVVVYTLHEANASGVASALQTAAPLARIGVGQNPRKLVVWAKPVDHDTIRATLDELDQEEFAGQGNVLKAYQIRTAEPGTLLGNLQTLFATRPYVRLSLDSKNRKIVAMATPSEHETIQRVIDEIESGSPIDEDAEFEVHPLRNADPTIVMQVAHQSAEQRLPGTFSTDARGEQLVAVATPEQQQTIRDTIDQLQSATRELEVFQLDVVDAQAAEVAIQRLFSAGGRGRNRDAPIVEADSNTARLYVRASQDDLVEIRDLLVKMGETRLAQRDGAGSNVRTIPFDGDTRAALVEIERVWPQLSKSPLRVLRGREGLRDAMTLPPTQLPLRGTLPARPQQQPTPPANDDGKASDPQSRREEPTTVEVKTAAQDDAPGATLRRPNPTTQTSRNSQRPKPPNRNRPTPQSTAAGADHRLAGRRQDHDHVGRSPRHRAVRGAVAIAFADRGHGRAQRLGLSTAQRRQRHGGRATEARVPPRRFRFRQRIRADHRSRRTAQRHRGVCRPQRSGGDRAVAGSARYRSDSRLAGHESAACGFLCSTPTRAASSRCLQDLYQTQLSSGARSKPIPIPSGASRDVAAVIQQINTAADRAADDLGRGRSDEFHRGDGARPLGRGSRRTGAANWTRPRSTTIPAR